MGLNGRKASVFFVMWWKVLFRTLVQKVGLGELVQGIFSLLILLVNWEDHQLKEGWERGDKRLSRREKKWMNLSKRVGLWMGIRTIPPKTLTTYLMPSIRPWESQSLGSRAIRQMHQWAGHSAGCGQSGRKGWGPWWEHKAGKNLFQLWGWYCWWHKGSQGDDHLRHEGEIGVIR